MARIVKQYTNEEDGLTAFVFHSELKPGTFGVSLRDDDSGEMLPLTYHGYSMEAAEAKARHIAGVGL